MKKLFHVELKTFYSHLLINLCRTVNLGISRHFGGNSEENLENHGEIPHAGYKSVAPTLLSKSGDIFP